MLLPRMRGVPIGLFAAFRVKPDLESDILSGTRSVFKISAYWLFA
jgi:hypothetical protein